MAQYIDKDALVAEIERRRNFDKRLKLYSRWDECNCILSFIDKLEVREVDLEKEFENYMDKYNGVWVDSDYIRFAKHFFELGLKAQKGEEV